VFSSGFYSCFVVSRSHFWTLTWKSVSLCKAFGVNVTSGRKILRYRLQQDFSSPIIHLLLIALLYIKITPLHYQETIVVFSSNVLLHIPCGRNVLGLMFLKIEDTWRRHVHFFFKFKITPLSYIQAFARSYNFWKAAENSSFGTFFNSSVTVSWISATSAKWSHLNFIFNLGNRK